MDNINFTLPFCVNCRGKKCSLSASSIKQYSKGDYIAYKGDRIKWLPFLVKGSIKTEIVSSSGLTLQVAQKKAPFPIAITLLFARNNIFPVDIIAVEECELVFIPLSIIEQTMHDCSEFFRGFLEFNAEALQFMSNRMAIFAQKGIKSKLSYYILSIEQKGYYRFDRSIISLAEYFGVERPSLSRAIAEMVQDNIITYNNGEGSILNSGAIQDLIK